MKKLLTILILSGFIFLTNAYDKLSLVERFTNCSCGPCATLNNSWYNATTADLINTGQITHIVYNVYWPSPGECDPMHLLNKIDNDFRTNYYGCNSVPWIEINGANVATTQAAFMNAVNNGNAEYSPFKIVLTPERLQNDVIDVHVKIIRDPGDVTTFDNVRLRIALTEREVYSVSPSCCTNGEQYFFSVCRKMLPDGYGSSFVVPSPGDSVEMNFQYVPTTEFMQEVNLDSIRVVAFIQDHLTQEMYQSVMENIVSVDRVNAAFNADETLGASPLTVNFSDYSIAASGNNIVSWEWDFDNDGTIDSYDENPSWTYTDEQSYSVSLTVSDGTTQHTRVVYDYITVLGKSSDILVVNGIAYAPYTTQLEDLYNSSACFGNHQVDVWDLFGKSQNVNYSANPNIQQVVLLDRKIPNSILKLYHKVIWMGNSYGGDEIFFDPQQVLNYITQGGNILLATREGVDFFDADLNNYCGITSFSGLSTVPQLIALDDSLVNISAVGTNDRNQFVVLDAGSEAVPIFDDNVGTNYVAGFRIQKADQGGFIYIAGRPYRFDNAAMYQDYNYMLDNWLNFSSVTVQSPNGGEVWIVGETEDITWAAVNINDVNIELSTDNGANWSTIVASTPNTGTYSWNVTAQDSSDECMIRITNVDDGTVYDVSDDVFTIDILSSLEEKLPGIPSEFGLTQNYPNPFNPVTFIKYEVPKTSPVLIKIYDITGREVAVLVNEVREPGIYQVSFDSKNLASGVYFYKMVAGDFTSVKKMNLLK
ncbi:MAG: T9SS type A sorting domain-containing protein [Ignavibacteriaceae bacterium]|nr:T9SS type A sorting domain-containing protein [Ignavibacteriaceae bacterium]